MVDNVSFVCGRLKKWKKKRKEKRTDNGHETRAVDLNKEYRDGRCGQRRVG